MHADQDINAHANPARINDLTGLNPITVWGVVKPQCIADIQEALRQTRLPLSIGGGHFSMGGQTACPGGLHLDLRQMNQVLHFAPQARRLRVQAGIRWSEVLHFLAAHELAPAVMPRHANYTVGGSLATNAPGWCARGGPLIEVAASLLLVLPNGECAEASPQRNTRLFYAAIGGYGAIGVIAEVELLLVPDSRLRAVSRRMSLADYAEWRVRQLSGANGVELHEASLSFLRPRQVSCLSWETTTRRVTRPWRLQGAGNDERMKRGVAWRNYVASADLGAQRWQGRSWVRVEQSFCIDGERLENCVERMREVLQRHAVAVIALRLTAVDADPGSLLAWTRGDRACVLNLAFRHPRDAAGREAVAVWMRELIEAVFAVGGCFLLSGQPHATPAQFMRAYPHAADLFEIKRELDPDNRLRNSLWDKYYQAWLNVDAGVPAADIDSVFHAVYDDVAARDAFYGCLIDMGGAYRAADLHQALRQACRKHQHDEDIYAEVAQALPVLRPGLAGWRFAWPRQRAEWRVAAEQVREQVGQRDHLTGWLEIGTGGELLARLAGPLRVRGDWIVLGERPPDDGVMATLARGRRLPNCQIVLLDSRAPQLPETLRDNSLDMVCCAQGLHGVPEEQRDAWLASLYRVLRPGGLLVVREHDVASASERALCLLGKHIQAMVQGDAWEARGSAAMHFASADEWAARLAEEGFVENGVRLSSVGDPLRRVCMVFVKRGLSGGRA